MEKGSNDIPGCTWHEEEKGGVCLGLLSGYIKVGRWGSTEPGKVNLEPAH